MIAREIWIGKDKIAILCYLLLAILLAGKIVFFSSLYIRVSQKVLESPGISKNVLEMSWKLECKSPGKSEK